MQFLDLVKSRRSIRSYQSRPVERARIDAVVAAAQLAPSAGDLQAYAIIRVEELENRQRLARAAHDQAFLTEAPVVLVFLADKVRSEHKYGPRGAGLFAVQDATIAAAYAQLAATAQGLGSCWVGAFDERRVAEAVSAPDELRPVVLMPVGYAAEHPAHRPRRDPAEMLWQEGYQSGRSSR